MKKLLFATMAVALAMPLSPAQAGESEREVYDSSWINVFWHSHRRLDADHYLLVTWYAGAYSSSESELWSDLYRSVTKCERREGRDRCSRVRKRSYSGVTDEGTFTIDRRLGSSHLEASYRVFRQVHGGREFVGVYAVSTDATGTGKVAHGRNTYTFHQGCISFSYGGRWVSREASATGTLTKKGEEPRDLGETQDASIGRSDFVEYEHSC